VQQSAERSKRLPGDEYPTTKDLREIKGHAVHRVDLNVVSNADRIISSRAEKLRMLASMLVWIPVNPPEIDFFRAISKDATASMVHSQERGGKLLLRNLGRLHV
jgi:hypothetical protein